MRRWRWLLIPVLAVALLATGVIYVLESVWVRERVRTLIVTEVEKATGGKTSLTAFDFDWRTLKVTASEFVIHGKEGPEKAPFLRVRAIRAGLTVRSWWQKDVELSELLVEKPQVHIYVNPDGTTNIPDPKVHLKTGGAPLEDLIRLKIARLDVRDGVFEYDSKHVPFSTLVQGLNLRLTYDKRKPQYQVTMAASAVHLPGLLQPRVEATAALEANRISLDRVRAFIGDSVADFTGAIDDFRHPKIDGQVTAKVLLRDIEISPVRQGFGVLTGKLHYSAERDFFIDGAVKAEQIAYDSKEFRLSRAQVESNFHLTTSLLSMSGLSLRTPLGDWRGQGAMRDWRGFELIGEATRVDLRGLQTAFLDRPYAWSGTARGPLSFRGELTEAGLIHGGAEAELSIEPEEGELPVRGDLDLVWSQETGKLDFGSSHLATDSARVNFHGALGERLEVGFFATRIRDLEPVIALLLHEERYGLPVRLQGGEARFDGLITGPLAHLDIAGRASISNVIYEGILFERAAGDVHLSESQLALTGLEVHSETAEATGSVRLGLADWTAGWSSAVTAKLQVKRMEVQRLLQIAKATAPLQGTLDAALEVGGTLGMPHGQVTMGVAGGAWDVEKFQDLKASVTLDGAGRPSWAKRI